MTFTCSERVAAFVTGFDLQAAPVELTDLAQTALIDTIGVMLAGSAEPASGIVCDMIASEAAAPAAGIVGRGLRTSPQSAALANGTATQALDFDLSFMSGQSAAAVVPAILPLAESLNATAEELIAAWVVGCEVSARIVRSFPSMSSGGSWHAAGVAGVFASAAACARLMQVPEPQIPAIMGIAASMPAGLGENYGTMTKPLHPGRAARDGMEAAFLGARGFTASASAIEGRQGFLALYARSFDWDPSPFDDLGEVYNLTAPGYRIKPFACGGLLHTSIEAALQLRDKALPRLDRIEAIRVTATTHAANRVIDRYPWSDDSSRFSLKYLVPYALIHGAPTLATFTEKALDDPRVRALSEKISTGVDREFPDTTAEGGSPGRVRIAFDDGSSLERAVLDASGSPAAPMTETVFRAKFDDCCAQSVDAGKADALYSYLRSPGEMRKLGDLWPLLSPE